MFFFYPQKGREKIRKGEEKRKTKKALFSSLEEAYLQESQGRRSLWDVYSLNVTLIPVPLFQRPPTAHHPAVASQDKSGDPESPPPGQPGSARKREPPTLQSDGQHGDNFWALGGRGGPGAAGKQASSGAGAWRIVLPPTPPRRQAQKPARAGLVPCRRPARGTLRVHTRTGCPVLAGRTGPATFPGHPHPAPLRPRTPRRPPRPCSGPAPRQPPLRARLSSAGLGLLFGRDASGERRLTRGGRARAGASTLSARSAPLPPSRLRRKRRPRDSPHRRPPGSPRLHRWPRRRPRVPQVPRAAEDRRRAEPWRASGRAARGGRCARTCRACALHQVSQPEPGCAGLTRVSLFSVWRPR